MSSRVYLETMYIWSCFSDYRNLGPSSFFFSSIVGSHASVCNYFTSNILNLPLYMLILSLCILSSFLVSLGRLYCTVSNHHPSYNYTPHCTVFLRFIESLITILINIIWYIGKSNFAVFHVSKGVLVPINYKLRGITVFPVSLSCFLILNL